MDTMQRRKKVETYDSSDLDFFSSSPNAQQGVAVAGGGDAAPVLDFRNNAQGSSQAYAPAPQPYNAVPVAAQPVAAFQTWDQSQQYTSSAGGGVFSPSSVHSHQSGGGGPFDESERPLSPIAVPSSLRPISKGIKKSPSAGILTALAVAESLAKAEETNATTSPALSVEQSSAAPPAVAAFEEIPSTSFSVSTGPIFAGESVQPNEFDAIADSAEALDSFSLEDTATANGSASAADVVAQEPWMPAAAQPWQPVTVTNEEQPPAGAAVATTDEDFFANVGEQQQPSPFEMNVSGPIVGAVEEEEIVVEEEKQPSAASFEPVPAAAEVEKKEEDPQHAPGSTWYGPDGYCYYLSPDGWKYWWDESAQQWQAHEYVGTGKEEKKEEQQVDDEVVRNVAVVEDVEVKQEEEAAVAAFEPPVVAEEELQQQQSAENLVSEPSWNVSAAEVYDDAQVSTNYDGYSAASSAPSSTFLPVQHAPITNAFVPQQQQPIPQQQYHQAAAQYPVQYHQQPQYHQQQQQSLTRPSAGFAKLSFGGRLVRVSPNGTITTHLLTQLTADVLQPVAYQAPTVSIHARHALLNTFPGPLGNNINKEKAAAFFKERKEACVCEEVGSNAEALHTLWSVLEAQVLHPPSKPPASPQAKGAGTVVGADAALAAALLPESAPAAPPSSVTAAPVAAISPTALASVQDLLLSGRKSEALQMAIQSHAWAVALVIARSLGAVEWQSAVEAFANAELSPAAPLRTMCMLVAGAGPKAIPAPQFLNEWRHHAAALALGHLPGSEQSLEALAASLLATGHVAEAHTCCILAGMQLQSSDAAPQQFSVVGTSRGVTPRTFASLPAILRTEIFTWSKTVGNPQAVPHFIWVLPYKLLHAYALAEMGMLSQSAQYCSSILTTLQSLGNKAPPGLAVCRVLAMDLNDRLQQHAAARKISLAGAFSAGSIVSSVGKLLDRGISALMGGEKQHSRSSSFTNDIPAGVPGHSRRSSVATVPSSPSAAMKAPSPPPGQYQAPSEAEQQSKPLLSNLMGRVASFVAPPTAPGGSGNGSGGGGVQGEVENAFYYDNELKIWRERGKEPPPPPEEPPPPPTAVAWQTPPPSAAAAPQSPLRSGLGGVNRYANQLTPGLATPMQQQSPSLLPAVGHTTTSFMPAFGGGGYAPPPQPFVPQPNDEMTEVDLR